MAERSFQLVVQMGPNVGKVYELAQDEMTIGRDISNLIVINDPEISRKHARLIPQADGFIIEDTGSTNGTFVNGQRLMGPHLLRHGETIMLGEKVSLLFEASSPDQEATQIGPSAIPAAPPPVAPVAPPAPPAAETYRVSAPSYEAYPPQPEPQPPAYQPPYQQPYQPPAYSGQVPPGPDEAYAPPEQAYQPPMEEEAPQQRSRTWLYVGCGCLVLFTLCCIVGALIYDYLDLYCQTPIINQILNCP
jgi:hypothetical protein